MPNWCSNTLKITGDTSQIKQLPWKYLDESTNAESSIRNIQLQLFESLLPCPKGLIGEEHYYWSIENWGIKWDCSIEIVDFNDDFLEIQFDSPWNAPYKGISKIAAKFPLLNFHMESSESGCDWRKSFVWHKGELVEQINGTYYAQSPSTCPECHSDYFPEIDLAGEITYRECVECGWTD
ncbi:MAG: hypothetical protein RLZZ574_76 [Cyanobacteriota bacterium]|jgi:hypothetical protein